VELPNKPEAKEEIGDPRTALKKDRKARIDANEGRRQKNAGEDEPKKKVVKEIVTRKLAQRLRKSRVGKALGGKSGRRR